MLTREEKLQITKQCDSQYDGLFFVGVLSTGIFCLPSCKAKMPLVHNIKFFDSKTEAITFGLRGCRRCFSWEYPLREHPGFAHLLKYLGATLDRKVPLMEMVELSGLNRSTLLRKFQEYLTLSPVKYHRLLRLQYAEKLLKQNEDVWTVSQKVGYSSISGFRDAFKRISGKTPGELLE